MITKAIILGREVGTNKYVVRIPLFESAGGNQTTFEASLCTNLCIKEEYKEGDIVFVGFEDHHIEKVVILGSLFLMDTDEPRGFANLQSLNVLDSAILPENTILGGISVATLNELVRRSYSQIDIPDAPQEDGNYFLFCEVRDGNKVYYWKNENTI